MEETEDLLVLDTKEIMTSDAFGKTAQEEQAVLFCLCLLKPALMLHEIKTTYMLRSINFLVMRYHLRYHRSCSYWWKARAI